MSEEEIKLLEDTIKETILYKKLQQENKHLTDLYNQALKDYDEVLKENEELKEKVDIRNKANIELLNKINKTIEYISELSEKPLSELDYYYHFNIILDKLKGSDKDE